MSIYSQKDLEISADGKKPGRKVRKNNCARLIITWSC